MSLRGLLTVTATVAAAALTAGSLAAAPARTSATSSSSAQGLFDLSVLPRPTITGAEIVDGLVALSDDYPLRVTGTPMEIGAADMLAAEMTALGYEAAVEPLAARAEVGTPGGQSPLKVVTATKRGTTLPDEWILFVGHYDTIATTVYGAYDNGSGTNMLRFLARALADVPTNRSIVFAWYNAEEEGLLASEAHAPQLAAAQQRIAAVLGFDMVGIGWPVAEVRPESCLCLYYGPDDEDFAIPILEHVNYGFLGFPDDRREVTIAGVNIRNSDEQSFSREGYRVFRWTGMRTASAYPGYHRPDDTMETILSVAGGRDHFEHGSLNTLLSAYYTALTVDNARPSAAFDVRQAERSLTVDAGASSDPDGELTAYRWDLGDGTTATGREVTHRYQRPGTYVVTLTVGDNLWPEVTTTARRTVVVP